MVDYPTVVDPFRRPEINPLWVEKLRVSWYETDASGRIHWSVPLRWAELAEHALYREMQVPVEQLNQLPRRAANVTYLLPLTHGDEIELRLTLAKLGRTSLSYEWTVITGGETAVSGGHTIVHVDESGRSAVWDASFRAALEARASGS